MSGPCTAIMAVDAVLPLLLAASAIEAARAVAQARTEAEFLRQEHEQRRRDESARQHAAAAAGLAAVQASVQKVQEQLDRLATLAADLGAGAAFEQHRPVQPGAQAGVLQWGEYLQRLQVFAQHARAALRAVLARSGQEPAERPMDVDRALQSLQPGARAAAVEPARGVRSAPLLRRLAHLPELPAPLLELAARLDAAPTGERADLLAMELALQVQLLADRELTRQVQQAQALVVQQSLEDLGYEVESFEQTLFTDGGMVHFRKRGWGDYMVRMRVRPQQRELNFNVVRAVDGAGAERGVSDHLAEDRWCAEFPALQKALALQGLRLQVTRQLEAGELPVQHVPRQELPAFEDADRQRRRQPQLRARDLP